MTKIPWDKVVMTALALWLAVGIVFGFATGNPWLLLVWLGAALISIIGVGLWYAIWSN